MTDETQSQAEKIVEIFRNSLDAEVRDKISAAKYEELALMIRELVSQVHRSAADLVDEVARQLRMKTDRPEIGL